jgi:hypothetical protein
VGFDFGDYQHANLSLNVIAPTTGGLNIKAKLNIKQD